MNNSEIKMSDEKKSVFDWVENHPVCTYATVLTSMCVLSIAVSAAVTLATARE